MKYIILFLAILTCSTTFVIAQDTLNSGNKSQKKQSGQTVAQTIQTQTKPAPLQVQPTEKISVVKWYTIEEALQLCKTKPKKIMIDVYTDWCGWCKKMDRDVFSHPVIARYLNENYYPVKFNAESSAPIDFNGQKFINENTGTRSTHQFAAALLKGQLSYPSIAYFTEKLEYMGAMPGYKSPEQLEMILNFIAQDKFKTTKMEEFEKTFVGKIKPAAGN
jgi:thioredoxin-related protein